MRKINEMKHTETGGSKGGRVTGGYIRKSQEIKTGTREIGTKEKGMQSSYFRPLPFAAVLGN
jgi:hypothetical protein